MKFQIYRTLGYRPNCERLLAVYPALANYNFEKDDTGNGYVTITSLNQLMQLIKEIGQELILPAKTFSKEPWRTDKKLFVLALVGLGLSVILSFAPFMKVFGIFYAVALYFSAIWGLFFFYLFKTSQVDIKTTAAIFFGTQSVIFIAYNIYFIIQVFKEIFEYLQIILCSQMFYFCV